MTVVVSRAYSTEKDEVPFPPQGFLPAPRCSDYRGVARPHLPHSPRSARTFIGGSWTLSQIVCLDSAPNLPVANIQYCFISLHLARSPHAAPGCPHLPNFDESNTRASRRTCRCPIRIRSHPQLPARQLSNTSSPTLPRLSRRPPGALCHCHSYYLNRPLRRP